MKRTLLSVVVLPLAALLAIAQDSGSLADNPPADNVKGGAVADRAPGNLVSQARAAHTERTAERLAAQRSGDTSSLAPESSEGTSSGGTDTGSGNALGDLLGGLLGGGSLGGSDLSGLLGGLLGGTGTDTGNGGSSNIPDNIPQEVIDLIRQFGLDPDTIFAQLDQGTSRSADSLPTDRSQTTTQPADEEPKFLVRWADSLLDSLFRGLTLAISTPQFRDILQDFFEPLFPATDSSNDNGDGNTNDNSNDNDNGNSNDNDNDNSNDNDNGNDNVPPDPNSEV